MQLETEGFSFKKNNKNILFITSVGDKRETKKYIKLWHLKLHSLYYFPQEHKLFRHDVLQLHILYPWLPNGDVFPTHSSNETLIDGTFQMLTVPSHML